jgi:hypothetical protein
MTSRGGHLESLADGLHVYRCVHAPLNVLGGSRVWPSPDDFGLSQTDKEGRPPHLSVWESCLADDFDRLCELVPTLTGKVRVFLRTESVRNVVHEGFCLDVVWTHWECLTEPPSPSPAPHSCLLGHAGIVGPLSSSDPAVESRGRSDRKAIGKALRTKLSKLATLSIDHSTD